jgi:magnesium transporter
MTVEEAIAFLRATKPLAEEAYYLYVLDGMNRLQGVVSLRQLIVADPTARIENVMATDIASVAPDTDQEEAARLLQHYRLRSLPVVDEGGVLSGIITADDVIDVIQEEATEDMYRMVGVGGDETALGPVTESLRRRVPWLIVNLFTAFLSALTVSLFQGTIEKVSTLAAFMPVIAGHGGNTGTQVTTLVVRGIALDEVRPSDAAVIVAKEIAFGLIHGVIVGTMTAGLAYVLSGNYWLSIVVFGAMVGNVLVAGVMGAIIPLGMRMVKIDPALASAIWLTTFTDVAGFLMLLGAGALLVSHLQ